jgi:hypothetical protein
MTALRKRSFNLVWVALSQCSFGAATNCLFLSSYSFFLNEKEVRREAKSKGKAEVVWEEGTRIPLHVFRPWSFWIHRGLVRLRAALLSQNSPSQFSCYGGLNLLYM